MKGRKGGKKMKKSLLVMIAALLVCAVMISCQSEPDGTSDRLVSVKIGSGSSSKSISASSMLNTDIENLYWYYTAEKTDNSMFITGQQTERKLIDSFTDENKTKGLMNANLGMFSTGSWKFSFYGYYPADDSVPSDLTSVQPAYQCVDVYVNITTDTSITLNVEAAEGLENASVVFGDLSWSYEMANEGTQLYLVVYKNIQNPEYFAYCYGYTDDNGSASFENLICNDPFLDEGLNTLMFKIWCGSELVGSTTAHIYASKGTVIELSGDIENLDSTYEVEVGNTVTELAKASYTILSEDTDDEIEVEFSFSPASSSLETEVEFPCGTVNKTTNDDNETTTSILTFTVLQTTEYPQPVAAFSLDLVKVTVDYDGKELSRESSNYFNDYIEIETYITKGLDGVEVVDEYGYTIHDVEYNRNSGELEFKTNLLATFYVFPVQFN